MNDLKEIINKYDFVVKKYRRVGNVHILYTDNGVYCLKKKQRDDTNNIINYLRAKQFNNVLNIKSDSDDQYEITDYIEEVPFVVEDKAMEAIYLLSMLHNKTTFYKSISLDEVKCFYERKTDEIINTKSYYENLCYIYEENLFLSPGQYLFLRNITSLFKSLDYSKFYLDKWYDIAKNKTSRRFCMNHNNLELSHIVIGETPYIINWNNSSIDMPVTDLHHFFRKNYELIDISSLFQIYLSKYQLLKEEIYLLFSLLLIPEKIELKNYEIYNTKKVYDNYKYLYIILDFISKNDLKYDK